MKARLRVFQSEKLAMGEASMKHMKDESKQVQLKGLKMIATDFINKL